MTTSYDDYSAQRGPIYHYRVAACGDVGCGLYGDADAGSRKPIVAVPTATKTVTPMPTSTKTVTPMPTSTKTVTPMPTPTKTVTTMSTPTRTATPWSCLYVPLVMKP